MTRKSSRRIYKKLPKEAPKNEHISEKIYLLTSVDEEEVARRTARNPHKKHPKNRHNLKICSY